jgi:hypothetical protein
MKYFLLGGFLLSSVLCFARDYDFTQAPDQQNRDAFRAWLRDRLDDEGDDVVISLNNAQSDAAQLSGALNANLANLQRAHFGDNGWNFAQALPIPFGISTVTFAPNHVYSITKEQQQRPQNRKGKRSGKENSSSDEDLGRNTKLPTLLAQRKELR